METANCFEVRGAGELLWSQGASVQSPGLGVRHLGGTKSTSKPDAAFEGGSASPAPRGRRSAIALERTA